MEITPEFLVGKPILFLVPLSSGIKETEYLESGTVASIDKKRQTAMIHFLYDGYKNACEDVPFSHIQSVLDEENGKHLEIEIFSGKAHDLRGVTPFGTHKIAETCAQ